MDDLRKLHFHTVPSRSPSRLGRVLTGKERERRSQSRPRFLEDDTSFPFSSQCAESRPHPVFCDPLFQLAVQLSTHYIFNGVRRTARQIAEPDYWINGTKIDDARLQLSF